MFKNFWVKIIYALASTLAVLVLPADGLASQDVRELLRSHYVQARDYYRKGEYEQAKSQFQEVLNLDPEHAGAKWYVKFVEDQLAKSKETLCARLAKTGQELEQARLEKKQAALKQYEQSLENKFKQNISQFSQLCKAEQTKLEDEFQKYEQSLQEKLAQKESALDEKIRRYASSQTAPLQDKPREKLVQVDTEQTKLFKLQSQLNEALHAQLNELKREKARPIYEQGLAYFNEQKYTLAKENVQRALSLYPDYPEAKKLLADIEAKEKINLYLSRGEYYCREGNYQKAREDFARVLSLDYINAQARQGLQKIEKKAEEKIRAEMQAMQKAKERQLKQGQLRLKREAEQKRQEEKRIALERKAKEEALKLAQTDLARQAELEAKEDQLRLQREAEQKRQKEARLKLEQEQKAKEEKLAQVKAEQEEKLRLAREAEAKRQEEKRIALEKKAEQEALKRAQTEIARQSEITAREQRLAQLKAEQKAKEKERQKKIDTHYRQGKRHFQNKDYIGARKEFKDILILDPKNQYALNALEKVEATIAREEDEAKRQEKQKEEKAKKEAERLINQYLAQGKVYFYQEKYQPALDEFGKVLVIDPNNSFAERYILNCKQGLAEQKRQEETRLKLEQERKAKEEKLAQVKAEQEEKLRLAQEAEAKRQEEKRIALEKKAEQEALKRAQTELARQSEITAREEKLTQLKAEKEEKLRLQREVEQKRQKEAQLKLEQERKAREEKLVQVKAEQEEKLRLQREAEQKRQKEARLERERQEQLCLQKEKESFVLEQTRLRLKVEELCLERERLAQLKAEQEEKLRLERKAEQKRQEEARLKKEQEQKAKEEAHLKQEQERKAKEEKVAQLKAEQEEKLRQKQEAEQKRREEARLKAEQERQAKEAQLQAKREEKLQQEAEKNEKAKQLRRYLVQGKIYYYQKQYDKAIEEFGQALLLDPECQNAENFILKCQKDTEQQKEKEKICLTKTEGRLKKKEKHLHLKPKVEAAQKPHEEARLEKKQQEQPRLQKEEEKFALEQARLKLKADELWLKQKESRLKKEQEQKAKEEARLKLEQERKAKEEKVAQLKAEQEEKLRQKQEAEQKRREEARLKAEQERQAKEAQLQAKREEKLQQEAEKNEKAKQLRRYLVQGKIYYYQKQYDKAIEKFGQALLLDPDCKNAEQYIIKCQKDSEAQKEKELTAEKEKALRLGKTAGLIKEEKEEEKLEKIAELYKKGKSYLHRGLYSEAIACFEQVIELEGNPRIHYTPQAQELMERAKTEMEEQKQEDAQKIAEEEVKRRQSQEAQKSKAAQKADEEARRKKEDQLRRHFNLGKTYYYQKNYPLAISEFNKIKAIDSQHSYVGYAEKYILRCRQEIMQREETELKTQMKKGTKGLIKEEPVSSKELLMQARWYYKRADFEQVAKICRAALELEPLNKEARALLHKAELNQIKKEKRDAHKEIGIDEKEMMTEVAKAQVLPEEKTLPVKEKEPIPIIKVPATREKLKGPITVDFRDVDLNYVLNFFSDSTGVNIIPASGVSLEGKKVTIRMKDIPAEHALKYLLKNQGLAYRIEEDAVWVASPSELDKEEVESRVYFLNRGSGMFTEFERTVAAGTGLGGGASISKITTLKDVLEKAVDWPKNSKLVLDERSGALVISNTPTNLQIIEDVLYNLDIAPMQVLIEARFVELEVTNVAQLGIEWKTTGVLGDKRRGGANITQWESGMGYDFTSFTRATEGLNLTYTGVLTYPEFQAVLHALSETTDAKTLSAPRVTTLNNQMATIKVVDEWIYPTKYEFQVVQSDINGDGDFADANETKYQNVPVDFVTKDVGILLHVTPNIGADGKTVTMALVPEVSEATAGYFSYAGSVSLPKFSSRTLSTSVVINNGETVALGGLVKETTSKTVTKVPVLGDIPILGYLFRKHNDSVVRKNLLIFVTASILSPSGEKIETVQQQ